MRGKLSDDFLFTFGPRFFVGVLLSLLGYQLYVNLSEPQYVIALSATDPSRLSETFFSGISSLVLCYDSKGATKAPDQGSSSETVGSGRIHPAFIGAAEIIGQRQALSEMIGFRAATLDCSQKLPSGKTTYEKLKLDPQTTPVLFHIQGGDKAYQINPTYLKKSEDKAYAKRVKKASQVQKDDETAEKRLRRGGALADVVVTRIKRRFLTSYVKNTKSLQACSQNRLCALLIGTSDKILEKSVSKALMKDLKKTYLKASWRYIDLSKYEFSLSKEVKYRENLSNLPTLMLFKTKKLDNKERLTTFTSLNVSLADITAAKAAINHFIEEQDLDFEWSQPLEKSPKVRVRTDRKKSATKKEKQAGADPVPSNTEKASDSSTSHSHVSTRERLAAEAEEFFPEFIDDDTEADGTEVLASVTEDVDDLMEEDEGEGEDSIDLD